jgi:hypothetical protein
LRDVTDSTLPDAARAFLDGDVDLLPGSLDDREIDVLVETLLERRDAARLQRLADARDKRLAKPARRGLHVLKTRGVALPAPQKREFVVRGPFAEADQPSLASLIDGRGERIVWLLRPNADKGFDLFQAEISESRGLLAFTAGAITRKDWRAHSKKLLDDARLGVAEIPARHARWLIEQAYQRTRVVPESFAAARLDLGAVEVPDRHPALDLAPPDPTLAPRTGELHQLYEVGPWLPTRESLQALDVQIGQIATSRLIVDATQRRQQIEEAILKEVEHAATPEARQLLANRLYETALLLASRGRGDEARLATTAAQITLDASVPVEHNGFLRRLWEKLIDTDRVIATPPSSDGP